MKFSIFDIMSKIIPGGLLMVTLLCVVTPMYLHVEEFKETIDLLNGFSGLLTILAIILTYFIGYIVDGLGSIYTEEFLWFTWGGWPVELIYQGKTTPRTTYPNAPDKYNEIIDSQGAASDLLKDRDGFDEFYYMCSGIVRRNGSENQNQRQQSYIDSYILSRNLFTAFTISIVVLAIVFFHNSTRFWITLSLSLLILLFIWTRTRDRALYQTRNLIDSTLRTIKK